MIAAMSSWWSGLSRRERILVSIAAALAGALAAWFLIVTPLQQALVRAADAHAAALSREAAVQSRVAALNRGRTNSRPASTVPVAQVIAQAAGEGGVTLARNDPAGDSGAAIAISNARSSAVLQMLAALEEQGVAANDLTLRPNGDGSIGMTATLRRNGS